MINFVVALMVEGHPLIEHFRLRENRKVRGFRVYIGDEVRLIVTGVGKVNAAAGVAYLQGFGSGTENEAWLNVGVAGHPAQAIGQGMHAVRVVDHATGRAWYPPRYVSLPGVPTTVLTVDRPAALFSEAVAHDMEASGFYASAVRFSTRELIQCYKIISDNRVTNPTKVTKNSVRKLIGDHISAVAQIADDLSAWCRALPAGDSDQNEVERFLHRWHFTLSQKHQLRDLLRRWHARTEEPVWDEELNRAPSAKAAMARIAQRFEQFPRL